MKRKAGIAFLLMLFVVQVVFSNYQITDVLSVDQDQFEDNYVIRSYDATSPYDFFNESKHPRYPLVNRPFGMIHYPNKANPVIISYGENFTIIVNASSATSDWEFILTNESITIDLDIINSEFKEDFWHFSVEPSLQIEGLYDMQLNCSSGEDYQTHAVNIVEEKEYPFTFLQVSDMHFPTYLGTNVNSTEVFFEELETIKTLDIDFVLCPGDLQQGPQWLFLNPEDGRPMSGESQLKLGLWALDLLNLPIYYIHGNHEFSQSTLVPDNLEDVWYKYLGPTRYQNFTYLDWSFLGFGSSFEGLTQKEIDSFKSIVKEECNKANVLYYHSDFAYQATSIISQFPIEIALFGHTHQPNTNPTDYTVYHDAGAFFQGEYSILSVIDATTIEIGSQTFNFSPLKQYTPDETTSYSFFVTLIPVLFIIPILTRKAKRKSS